MPLSVCLKDLCVLSFSMKLVSYKHFSSSLHRYHQIQPGAMDQLITGLAPSMDPLEALLGPFPCARVRGLPFEATPEDVLVFFQGLVVIDVVLVPNAESGEAYVVFTNLIDYQMGLQR